MTRFYAPEYLADLEDSWTGRPGTPGELPWLPYPSEEFNALMVWVRIHAQVNATYFELGAGIGTKVLMAQQGGFRASGVEICELYAAKARQLGAAVQLGDVRSERTLEQVALSDVVYMNHPLADRLEEFKLEQAVQARLRPGAILVTVRSANPPHGSPWSVLCQLREGDLAVRKDSGR